MSEPRKSRREPKLSQRFKDFLGEDSSSVKSQTPVKGAKAAAKTEPKNVQSTKTPAKKVQAVKTPAAKPSTKTLPANASAKSTPEKSSPAPKPSPSPAAKAAPKQTEAPQAKPHTPSVTQNVRKTSIKEAKKAAAASVAVNVQKQPEPEPLRTKRVSKPSAKITEAMESEAVLAGIPPKKKAKVVGGPVTPKILSPSATVASVGRGGVGRGRGRGAGRGGVGRGRGRGRGGAVSVNIPQDEESMEEEEEEEEDEEKDDEELEDEEMEDEDDEMDVEEQQEEEVKTPKPVQVKNKLASAGPFSKKVSVAVNPPNSLIVTTSKAAISSKMISLASSAKTPVKIVTTTSKISSPASGCAKKVDLPINSPAQKVELPVNSLSSSSSSKAPLTVKAPLTGIQLNPIVKKNISQSPSKSKDSAESPKDPATGPASPKGLKRPLAKTQSLVSADPNSAKKIKLVQGKLVSPVSASALDSPVKISTTSTPIKLSKIVSSKEASKSDTNKNEESGTNGVKSSAKMTVIKTMANKGGLAKTPLLGVKKSTPVKVPSPSSGSDNDTRRSRRQPKPTERLKEFLHREAEEAEDDVAPMLHTDDDSDEDKNFDEGKEDDDDLDDELMDEDEENSQFLAMMKNNASSSSKKLLQQKKNASALGLGTKMAPFKTQVVRKLGGNTLLTKSIQGALGSKGLQKTPQIKANIAPGSKVAVNRPVNGDKTGSLVAKALTQQSVVNKQSKTIVVQRVVKQTEVPIIIKVRTLSLEDVEMRKKKKEEREKDVAGKKVIKITTETLRTKYRPSLSNRKNRPHLGSDESEDSADPLLHSDDSEEEEEEEEMDEEEEDDDEENLNSSLKNVSHEVLNKKLLELCKSAMDSLNVRRSQFQAKDLPKGASSSLTKQTVDKFVNLCSVIIENIKTTIAEEGENLSDATNFEEYCQDVLDSINLKGDEEELAQREAEDLLLWLQEASKSVKNKAEQEQFTNQMMLYNQILELLSSAMHEQGLLDKFNATDYTDEGEDEDMDELEHEDMLSDDDMGEEEEDGGEEEEEEDGKKGR